MYAKCRSGFIQFTLMSVRQVYRPGLKDHKSNFIDNPMILRVKKAVGDFIVFKLLKAC